jgi:Flp pilus assembly protein TadG
MKTPIANDVRVLPRPRPSSLRRGRRQRRATTTVEFAVTLPLVLLLFFGSIEFARVNLLRHTAAQAAYEGARRGIVPGATASDVQTVAQQILNSAFASGYTVAITPSTITRNTTQVTVDISIPLTSNSWVAPMYFGGKTLTKSFTLQRELNDLVSVP